MSKKLQKSLQTCLSKIKIPTPNLQNSISSSKKWVVSSFTQPKKLSFSIRRRQDFTSTVEDGGSKKESSHHQATLSDVDRFLFENFRSLYIRDDDHGHQKQNREGNESDDDRRRDHLRSSLGEILFDESGSESERFFAASGSSDSFIDEPRPSFATSSKHNIGSSSTLTSSNEGSLTGSNDDSKQISLPNDSIAVLRPSSNPCCDFQGSMQELVDARLQETGKVDWDYMEEILFCYLKLNERKFHKFVLNAFADLVVKLRRSDVVPTISRSSARVARERRRRSRKM